MAHLSEKENDFGEVKTFKGWDLSKGQHKISPGPEDDAEVKSRLHDGSIKTDRRTSLKKFFSFFLRCCKFTEQPVDIQQHFTLCCWLFTETFSPSGHKRPACLTMWHGRRRPSPLCCFSSCWSLRGPIQRAALVGQSQNEDPSKCLRAQGRLTTHTLKDDLVCVCSHHVINWPHWPLQGHWSIMHHFKQNLFVWYKHTMDAVTKVGDELVCSISQVSVQHLSTQTDRRKLVGGLKHSSPCSTAGSEHRWFKSNMH